MSIARAFLLAFLLFCSMRHDAQTIDTTAGTDLLVPLGPPEPIYELFELEKPPVYPGGDQTLMKYIAENLEFPTLDRSSTPPGKIVISFVVDKNGRVRDGKIRRAYDPKIEIGGPGFFRSMPAWQPASKDGRAVAVRYWLPIYINWQ